MVPSPLRLGICRPRLLWDVSRRELASGVLIGVVFFLGFVLQVTALTQEAVTPSLSAFLTSLACVWAPLLAWPLFGARLSGALLPGLAMAVGGTALLCWDPEQ